MSMIEFIDEGNFEIDIPLLCFGGNKHNVRFFLRFWDWKPLGFDTLCDIFSLVENNIPCIRRANLLLDNLRGNYNFRVMYILDSCCEGKNYLPDAIPKIALAIEKCRNPDITTVIFREFRNFMLLHKRIDKRIVDSVTKLIATGILGFDSKLSLIKLFASSCVGALRNISNYMPLAKDLVMNVYDLVMNENSPPESSKRIVADILKSIPSYYLK